MYERLVYFFDDLIKIWWKLFVKFCWKYGFVVDCSMCVSHNKICIMWGSQFQSLSFVILPKVESMVEYKTGVKVSVK